MSLFRSYILLTVSSLVSRYVGLHSTLAVKVGQTQKGKLLLMDHSFTCGIDKCLTKQCAGNVAIIPVKNKLF